QLMMQHIQSAPDLSSLPVHDRPVVGRALAKVPDQRFATCAEMVKALRDAGKPADDQTPVPAIVRFNRTSNAEAAARGGAALSPRGRKALPALNANQKLPPLVNQRAAANAALANARLAPPEQLGSGVLYPAMVVGLGHFGLLVLQRLRRTLRDRF